MKEIKSKCLWCEKSFMQKKWVVRSGILKGHNMISSVCCSSVCTKKLHTSLKLASAIQEKVKGKLLEKDPKRKYCKINLTNFMIKKQNE